MIKNIFRIYKGDIKRIFTNYAAIIIIIALALLPSLYAWINIAACWDPYSQSATGEIKVAVVNKDKGTVLNEEEINLGNRIVDNLKENKILGWNFMSEEESDDALKKGKIFASITIDEEFSEELTSFLTSDIKKGKIIYSVNEKINAIAPKITSKGATAIQAKVTEALTETVSRVLLESAQEAGYAIKDDVFPKFSEAEVMLEELQGRFGEINSTMDEADFTVDRVSELLTSVQNDLPLVENTLNNTEDLTNNIKDFVNTSKSGLSDIAPTIKNDLGMINEISKEIAYYSNAISNAVNANASNIPQLISSIQGRLRSAGTIVDSVAGLLEKLNNISGNNQLDDVLTNVRRIQTDINTTRNIVDSLNQSINNGGGINTNLIDNVKIAADDINNVTANILNVFDTEIVAKINNIGNQIFQTAENVLTVLNLVENKIPQVNEILKSALDLMETGNSSIDYLKGKLPEIEDKITDLKNKISEVNSNEELKDIIDLLLTDVQERTDFLANPVEVEENDLYPMGNYGSAMTPFYSVLCLWVGQTLLVSMLSTEVHGAYSHIEEYFGKFLLFLSITTMQAVIAALGDLYLLNIYCVNPGVFLIGLVYTGIVFTSIVYTLVSVFGNVGKVTAIILLVLQVAGSGGTFPVQLTPKFFQVLNPYLPFTYAISFEREAIGGIVEEVLRRDILIMAAYIAGSIIIAVLFKKIFNRFMRRFTEKFEESGMGE